MSEASLGSERAVRYEPDDRPPTALAFGLGAQQAVLCIAGVVLTPVIVIRAAGGDDSYMTWAVFAALLVSGLTTMMQAVRIGRIGAGYPLLMGTSGAFIAVCVTSLVEGGGRGCLPPWSRSRRCFSSCCRSVCRCCGGSSRPPWPAR